MSPARDPLAAVTRARAALGGCPEAVRHTVRLLITGLAASRGLAAPCWPPLSAEPEAAALAAATAVLSGLDVTGWDINDVGAAYEHLMTPAGRKSQGSYYTPPELARFMVRFSVGPQLDRLAGHPDPANMLQVLAVDPTCGAGVFLVEAARYIAARYAERLTGTADAAVARLVLPEVMSECVFGMDRDPAAVDLSKAAMWFELGGEQPIGFMDRNVICCDALAGQHAQPPKLAERLGEPAATDPERLSLLAGER